MEHAVLDRFLRPFAECLTPEVAQRLVDLELDPHSQLRLNELAAKANEGHLTGDERREYEEFVEGIDLSPRTNCSGETRVIKDAAAHHLVCQRAGK